MKKNGLNYTFYNNNTPDAFARLLLNVCMQANAKKAERAIREELCIAECKEDLPETNRETM